MANRINYERVMEETITALERDGQRPQLLLHACCAPCSSATLERLADHFDVTILYYNPNIAPPEEYHRREAELERFVRDAGYAARGITVVELPYDPQEFLHCSKRAGKRAGARRALHRVLPHAAGTRRPVRQGTRL